MVICLLLLLNIFSQFSLSLKTAKLSIDPGEERLNQSQSQFNIGKILFTRDNQSDYIQSFGPTLPVITRVELYLGKRGNPSFDEICVSIKNEVYG